MKTNLKKNGGFTLVELIVVIAILAILAAVAIPAYNGYIEKAKEAADEQLLAAVNKAFASACLENGIDVIDVTDAKVKWDNKCVTGITKVNTLDANAVAAYDKAFNLFYEGNKTTQFQVFKGLKFDKVKRAFEGTTSLLYNGVEIMVDPADIEDFKDSNWSTIGSEELLDIVSQVTGIAAGISNDALFDCLYSPDFQNAAAEVLGYETWDETLAYYNKLADDAGITDTNERTAFIHGVHVKNAVLVASRGAEEAGATIIDVLLDNENNNAKTLIKGNMTTAGGDAELGLAQATLAYGLYSSFLVQQGGSVEANNDRDFTKVYNLLNAAENEGSDDYEEGVAFKAYLNSPQAQKDLAGCLAAMNAVSSNSAKEGVGTNIIAGEYNDPELIELLKNVLGG